MVNTKNISSEFEAMIASYEKNLALLISRSMELEEEFKRTKKADVQNRRAAICRTIHQNRLDMAAMKSYQEAIEGRDRDE